LQSKNIPQAREPVARRAERAEGEERISAGKFYSVFCLATGRSPAKNNQQIPAFFVFKLCGNIPDINIAQKAKNWRVITSKTIMKNASLSI